MTITDEQAIALARRWAKWEAVPYALHEFLPPLSCTDELDRAETDALFGWLRQRAEDYREGALAAGYDADPPRDELAEWIGLDLYEPFESDPDLTAALLVAALEAAP